MYIEHGLLETRLLVDGDYKNYKTENREESWFLKKLFCFSSQSREKVKLNTEICWSIPLLKERCITINVFFNLKSPKQEK